MLIGHLVGHAFVAIETERVAAAGRQLGKLRGMRIVATEAFATFEGLMLDSAASRECRHFMTLQAES